LLGPGSRAVEIFRTVHKSLIGRRPAQAELLGSTSREERVMYRPLYARDVFDLSPSIRGIGRGGFPALNIGGTPTSVEIYAFAPGLDPASMEVNLDRG